MVRKVGNASDSQNQDNKSGQDDIQQQKPKIVVQEVNSERKSPEDSVHLTSESKKKK